jgi:hypothetical protein
VKITPRADERAKLIAALEAEYPSDRVAADTLFQLVVDLLSARDAYGIRIQLGEDMHFAYGPWWHRTIVKKFAGSLPGASFHPLASAARLEHLAHPDSHRRLTGCPTCAHPRFAHGFPGKRGCVVKGCKCKELDK